MEHSWELWKYMYESSMQTGAGIKMKVLMVNKFLFPNGGSETYIFEIGKQLQKLGHEVQYFGMEHEGRIVGNHAESYTSDMNFHSGGISKLLYPFKIIYSKEARKKIRRVLNDFQPNVVHLNNFNFQITPSVIYEIRKWEKTAGKKVPIIFTAHDYQWVCPNHMMMIPSTGELCFQCEGAKFGQCTKNRCIHNSKAKSLIGTLEAKLYHSLQTYGKVDAIICPSRFMAEKLETNPLLAEKLIILYNFLGKTNVPSCEKKDYVLYFGRYSEEKGVRTLLQVCAELKDIPFYFAGSGPLKEELKKCSNIKELGFLKGEELQKIISEARFVIFPSEWYENCPFSVMEAQEYGTPLIASNIGGVPELMKDQVTGELFEAGNVTQLKGKVERLWQDKELCRQYSENCRSIQFDTVEEYCVKLIEIYKKLINR